MDNTVPRMKSFKRTIAVCAILHMLLSVTIANSKTHSTSWTTRNNEKLILNVIDQIYDTQRSYKGQNNLYLAKLFFSEKSYSKEKAIQVCQDVILIRTFASESKRRIQKSDETLTANIFYEELQPATEQKYGTRTLPPSKPYCSTNCDSNKDNKDTENQTSSSRAKYDSTNYNKEQRATTTDKLKISKPTKISEKIKFSKQFNPSTGVNESGFVPIPSPFKPHSTKSTPARRRAKLRSVDELTVKESRPNSNILGNGHFEILRGGIFSDHETNEIPGGGRRVGNTYDPYALPQFRQVPFDVVQFPSMYQRSQLQLPTHPMFFPRGAFSHKSELKMRQ